MSDRPSLVLAGHGFPRQPHARHPAENHAERLRGAKPFGNVSAGLLHGQPELSQRLQALEDEAVIVPLFVSDGYFAGEMLPDLITSHCPDTVSVTHTPPVGTHDDVTTVIERRATAAVDGRPEGVELALLGHGATRQSANRQAVDGHARRLRERSEFDAVRSYFLEEEPRIERLAEDSLASTVVAVPVFVAEGHHVREEIPELLGIPRGGGTSDGVSITYTDPVGTDPLVAGVAFGRAMAALDKEPTALSRKAAVGAERPGGETP